MNQRPQPFIRGRHESHDSSSIGSSQSSVFVRAFPVRYSGPPRVVGRIVSVDNARPVETPQTLPPISAPVKEWTSADEQEARDDIRFLEENIKSTTPAHLFEVISQVKSNLESLRLRLEFFLQNTQDFPDDRLFELIADMHRTDTKTQQFLENVSYSTAYESEIETSQPLFQPSTAVQALRRGNNRVECNVAISHLIDYFQSKQNQDGTLHVMLSTIYKISDWPEVEIQVTIVICLIICLEDDKRLLNVCLSDVLSVLYVFQQNFKSKCEEIFETGTNGIDCEAVDSKWKQWCADAQILIGCVLVKFGILLASQLTSESDEAMQSVDTLLNITQLTVNNEYVSLLDNFTKKRLNLNLQDYSKFLPSSLSCVNKSSFFGNHHEFNILSLLGTMTFTSLSASQVCRHRVISSSCIDFLRRLLDELCTGIDALISNADEDISQEVDEKSTSYQLLLNIATTCLQLVNGGVELQSDTLDHFLTETIRGNKRDYTLGFIDAKIISAGVHRAIVNVLYKIIDLQVILSISLDQSVVCLFVESLFHLSSRSTNRIELQLVGTPTVISLLVEMLTDQLDASSILKDIDPLVPTVNASITSRCVKTNLSYCVALLKIFLDEVIHVTSIYADHHYAFISKLASVKFVSSIFSIISTLTSSRLRLNSLRIISYLMDIPTCLEVLCTTETVRLLIKLLFEAFGMSMLPIEFDSSSSSPLSAPSQEGISPKLARSQMKLSEDEILQLELAQILSQLTIVAQFDAVCLESIYKSRVLPLLLQLMNNCSFATQVEVIKCMSTVCECLSHHTNFEEDKLVLSKRIISLFSELLRDNSFHVVYKQILQGLGNIAYGNDMLHLLIVEKPLISVVDLLMDYRDKELMFSAELVLKRIGFIAGIEDLRLCGFDLELFTLWFMLKQSIQPQCLGNQITQQWFDDMFRRPQHPREVLLPRVLDFIDVNQLKHSQRTLFSSSPQSSINSRFAKFQSFSTIKKLFFSSATSKSSVEFFEDETLKGVVNETLNLDDRLPSLLRLAIAFRKLKREDWLSTCILDLPETSQSCLPSMLSRCVGLDVFSLGLQDHQTDGSLLLPSKMNDAILVLPRRNYQTFLRVSRIIERIIDESGNEVNRWGISFEDSEFHGEFYESLLAFLRSATRVSMINFSSSLTKIEVGTKMGYLVANLPSHVRIFTCKGIMSKESVQTLCILLRNSIMTSALDTQGQSLYDLSTVTTIPLELLRGSSTQGLQYLGITHTMMEEQEVSYIVSLLSADSASQQNVNPTGLRFLDLSSNKLGDVLCAEVLKGASKGLLEGLYLNENNISNGPKVLDELKLMLEDAVWVGEKGLKTSFLRHLGLASNNLSSKFFSKLLSIMATNRSIASLNVSDNEAIFSTASSKDIRKFLKSNSYLRLLNLSKTKLTIDIAKELHLGLLENSSLLMLLMQDNVINDVAANDTFEAISLQLYQNRQQYALSTTSKSYSEKQTVLENPSDFLDSSSPSLAIPNLQVLFSSPLAWRDQNNLYHPMEQLDYIRERESMIQMFREARRNIAVTFDFATTEKLTSALAVGCKVLHFSGHGNAQFLTFEDTRCGLQPVLIETLKKLLCVENMQLNLVFVSACHSRKTGQAFIDAGVAHVVCVKVEEMVQDLAAMSFTRAFYIALLSGRSVKQAFLIAKETLKASPYVSNSVMEGEKFVLLPESDTHDEIIFHASVVPHWPSLSRGHISGSCYKHGSWIRNSAEEVLSFHTTIPALPPDFEGRQVDMHRVISQLLSRRFLSIVGEDGLGKKSLAIAVCHYISARGFFDDGVVFVRTSIPTSYLSLLQGIQSAINTSLSSITSTSSKFVGDNETLWLEEWILQHLANCRLLLTIVDVDGLQDHEAITMFKLFLARICLQCPSVKLLVTSRETLQMRQVSGFDVLEQVVSLGPLTLRSSLRLFAKLSPFLVSSVQKQNFVNDLLPRHQANVTMCSADLDEIGEKMLTLFCEGHPARIVKMVCQSNCDVIAELLTLKSTLNKSPEIEQLS